jgi:hypothetical protein
MIKLDRCGEAKSQLTGEKCDNPSATNLCAWKHVEDPNKEYIIKIHAQPSCPTCKDEVKVKILNQ